MEQRKIKPRKPLNIHHPTVQALSEQYNIAPKVIAYIRAAMREGTYTRLTLVEHIEIENEGRKRAIAEHKTRVDIPEDQRDNLIKYTQINIDFRVGVVDILKTLSDEELNDIIKRN